MSRIKKIWFWKSSNEDVFEMHENVFEKKTNRAFEEINADVKDLVTLAYSGKPTDWLFP